jgi:GT2 family glycosyltransferase
MHTTLDAAPVSRTADADGSKIQFSVVVPTHNRPSRLHECLESLSRQEYPRDRYETIVVDDGGRLPLDDIVRAYEARMQVRLVRQARTGPGPARNAGARVARGAWLAFTDDDCRPAPQWLRTLEHALSARGDCAAGGRTVNALERSRYSSASQSLVSYLYSHFSAAPRWSGFFASNNLAVPAGMFAMAGGFDTSVPLFPAEDRDLCDRLGDIGCALVYVPDALVSHAHALTLRGFCRQHFIYGRGAWRYHRLRATRRHDRIRIEPVTFYWRLIRYPFRAGEAHPWTTAALLTLAQVVHTAGFFWERCVPGRPTPVSY